MTVAFTRGVSPAIGRCELSHLEREPIDVERARVQHLRYEQLLSELGCEVRRLPAEPLLPDSVFVEDVAVVLDELAVITRPGASSRRAEVPSIASALERYRPLARLEPPAEMDGGDVLRVGRTLFVGQSRRTNRDGIRQMETIAGPHGYTVRPVPVQGCLHLKSAATLVAADTLLVQPEWVAADAFAGLDRIEVDPSEPFGANALLVGDSVVYPSAHAGTRLRLEDRGIRVRDVDVSELARAEGGVTCCCLLLTA